jgi:hypothetical protein
MIPAPNVFAGLLIGVLNTSWLTVVLASFGWSLAFCGYVSIADTARRQATIEGFRLSARRLLFSSPKLTFYAIEFATALVTSLPIGCLTYLIKRIVT